MGVVLVAIPAGIFISRRSRHSILLLSLLLFLLLRDLVSSPALIEFMRLHEARKLEESKVVRHEIIFEELRGKIEEMSETVERYHMSREKHADRLRRHYERKVKKAHVSRAAPRRRSSFSAVSLVRRLSSSETRTRQPETTLDHVDLDEDIPEESDDASQSSQMSQLSLDHARQTRSSRTHSRRVCSGGFLGAASSGRT